MRPWRFNTSISYWNIWEDINQTSWAQHNYSKKEEISWHDGATRYLSTDSFQADILLLLVNIIIYEESKIWSEQSKELSVIMSALRKIHQLTQMRGCISLTPNVLKIIFMMHSYSSKNTLTFIRCISVAGATTSEHQ